MKDTQEKLSTLTIALHWLVALTIIGLIAVGIYMEENEAFSLYPIHKSVGVLIFSVVLVRIVWRLINGWPEPLREYEVWEHSLAKLVHWVLIIGTVAFPLSGMIMSGAGGYGIPLFGLELVPMNVDPANAEKIVPYNKDIAGIAHEIHVLLGDIMIVAIILHVAGALKHHIADKDQTLRRMIGQQS